MSKTNSIETPKRSSAFFVFGPLDRGAKSVNPAAPAIALVDYVISFSFNGKYYGLPDDVAPEVAFPLLKARPMPFRIRY